MPSLSADDIPGLIESPEFNALPFEKRQSIAEDALSEGAASLAGKWNKETYQQWGQFAQQVRSTVSESESMVETAGRYAGVAGGAIKDSLATIGTTALGLSPTVPTADGFKGQIPGETIVPMIGANLAGLATNAAQSVLDDPKPLQGKLAELKRGIDEGAFFDDGDGLPGWLEKQDAAVRGEQAKFYRESPDAGGWHKDNSLLGRPENAEALNVYLRTRSPQAWQQLESSILQTPGMRRIEREKAALTNDSTLAQALKPEAQHYIQEAGDPAELAGMAATAGAGNAALKAGKTMLQRGVSVAKGVGAEMLSEQVSASMDNAFVPWEQRVQIAKDSLAASLGLMGASGAVSRLANSGQPKPAAQPATAQEPGPNPFSGPIQAPPQPTEEGGEVTSGPVPVPAFQDDPFNAAVPPAGGNVLVDFGIAKSPNAQAIADSAEQNRQQQIAKLRSIQNMAGNGRPTIPDSPLGGRDILDYVNENPIYIPRKNSTAASQAENDWSETYNIPLYYRKFLGNSEGGHNAADLAQMAYDANYIHAPTADALMQKIDETIRARTTYKVEMRKRDKALEQEGKSVLNFERDQATRAQADKALIPLEQVSQGDEMTINGEAVTVRKVNYDEDGNLTNVVIEDGKRYGVLSLDPATRTGIFVDEWQPKAREEAARDDDPFLPDQSQPDLAAEKAKAAQRVTAAEEQHASLRRQPSKPQPTARENEDGSIDIEIPLEDDVLPMPPAFQQPAVRGPLPSTSGNTPVPKQVQAWSGKLHTLHGIRHYLLNAVGMPAVGVGRFKRALGIYKVNPETIRLQAQNDIPVLAHEIGHSIHYRILSDDPATATDWGGTYDGELLAMGQATSLPTYTRAQVRKEGVAEFIRGWLIDPAGIRAKAPRFSAFFEQEMESRNPKAAEALRNARFMIQDYIAMPAWAKLQSQIVLDPTTEKPVSNWRDELKWVYTKMVNTLAPLEWTLKDITAKSPGHEQQAQDVMDWLENHRGGWASKARQSIFGQQIDLKGNVVGQGFQSILNELQAHDIDPFRRYLVALRAMEMERRGLRSGFENATLPAAEMAQLKARFEPTRLKLLKWQRQNRDLLVQSGILDGASAAKMDALNEDYVPFYRLYEKANNVSFGPENSKNAGGFVNLQNGINRLKGSDLAIIDPLQSMMKNAFMFRKVAEQNLIANKFFELLKDVQGHGQWGEGIAPKMKAQITKHDDIVQKLIDEGVIQSASDLPANADLTLKMWQAAQKPDSKHGEVIVFKNGKATHWEVKDSLLLTALKHADADSVALGDIPGFIVKIFTAPTKLLRFGATGGPWFALPNMLRDAVIGGVQSSAGSVPFWDSFKGIMEVLRKGGHYEAWKNAGGQFSGLVTGTEAFTALLEDALPKDRSARALAVSLAEPKTWRAGFRQALILIGEAGRITEEGTRVGEFMRAKETGMNERAAANASKNVSLNFARAGQVSRVLNMFIPFFNANIQSLDQTFRLHKDPKTRGQVMTRGLMYITAPSIVCWALGKDDEEIQQLPEWRKNLFWNINLKPLAAALGRPGFVLSIPKPFLLGAIYGTSIERGLDYATGRDPNGARKAASNILKNTFNPFDMMVAFGGMKPLIEAATNHAFWMDRPIVPEQMQNLPPEQQYDLYTSQTARLLARATGHSPMIIDHMIQGYFATAGKWGVGAIDWTMAKTGLANVPPAPRRDMMEMPILNRFAGSPYAANAYVDRFYKASEEMDGLLKVWNKQSDQMTTEDHQRWWKKHGPEILAYTRTVDASTGLTGAGEIRKQMAALSEINGAMKDIQASQVIAPEVKRQRLLELSQQRNQAAEAGFKYLFPESVRRRLH